MEITDRNSFGSLSKMWLNCPDFQKTHICAAPALGDVLCRTPPKFYRNIQVLNTTKILLKRTSPEHHQNAADTYKCRASPKFYSNVEVQNTTTILQERTSPEHHHNSAGTNKSRTPPQFCRNVQVQNTTTILQERTSPEHHQNSTETLKVPVCIHQHLNAKFNSH
jgi:hypothetical protein